MGSYAASLGWLVLFTFFLVASSDPQPLYTLITPSILRVDSEETIIVEAHDHTSPFSVQIRVFDYPQKNSLFVTEARLNPDDGLVAAKIKVPAIKKKLYGNQYVYIQATSSFFTLETIVLLSFQNGYIFIQTDKTIYTPGSIVRYRLFTVGHVLDPQRKQVAIGIVNPDGMMIEQNLETSPDGIITQSYRIPDIVINGIWKIVSTYEHSQVFATEFEIKEYVLPNFEVTLESSKKFFYVDDNELIIDITARFLFGEMVTGQAFALFGVKKGDTKKSIPESLNKVPIQNGKGRAELTRTVLQKRFPNLDELVGHSIYVSVTVLTETGSDMVQEEKSGFHIVRSPYKIVFPKASMYFKPGMPFTLLLSVVNPDGSPASGIPVISVSPAGGKGISQEDGMAHLVVNTPPRAFEISVEVKTADSNLVDSRQSTAVWRARAYQTPGGSGNYLLISVTHTELKPGDTLSVSFHLLNSNPAIENQIHYFTYLILNKGKVFKAGRHPRKAGQNPVTMALPVTPELIPSFRIVAYYKIGYNEIVADSVWVDVKDTCMGKLKVTSVSEKVNQVHKPGADIGLKVSGDPGAKVGLVAVDKAVYVLNKKFKFSQSKIWDAVEKNDIGCTTGGGSDTVGVFVDAGLTLRTSSNLQTGQRCTSQRHRRRRSVDILEKKAAKAQIYQNQIYRKCCEDGMQENPMGYSCERRARYILETPECIKAFKDCCNHIFGSPQTSLETQTQSPVKENSSRVLTESYLYYSQVVLTSASLPLGPSEDEGDWDEDEEEPESVIRSNFAESWLWQEETLPMNTDVNGISSAVIRTKLQDSITTWEVLAISLSQTKGICVADPYEIMVKEDFFVDLRLPYSVVRNEEVQIRAVVYNYGPWPLTVRVDLVYNEKICSFSTPTKPSRQQFTIFPGTSKDVTYQIIPLESGEVEIEVKAVVRGLSLADTVRKKLRVVPEGMQIFKTIRTVLLNPASASQEQLEEIPPIDLSEVVPNTEPLTFISVTGNIVAETIENSIDGANLKGLIQAPSGCGEQNMIGLTPTVIATQYLDKTNQWERVGLERRSEAINLIKKGCIQQLAYRKKDGSYAAFIRRPSSTWLTAYVVKIFAMAAQLISIDERQLCEPLKWLINTKQKSNGAFREEAPVIHGEMMGGSRSSDPEVSLTAFVLIAMHEANDICLDHVSQLDRSIQKAGDYLAHTLNTLQKSYSVAIATYALSLLDRDVAATKLLALSTGTHWPHPNSKLHSIEATSYGLLALIQLNRLDIAKPIVHWLIEQRFYGGGYGSTQATVMVFQALAQYQASMSENKDEFLDVFIKLPQRNDWPQWRINYGNSMVSQTAQTTATTGFTVSAKGTGKGTLSVMRMYYTPLSEETVPCNKFDVTVAVEKSQAKKSGGALASMDIQICIRFLGEVDAAMTIVDISMMTGFSPDMDDLEKLTNSVDKYISKYEMNDVLSDKSSLILYLDKVSKTEHECLKFRLHQYFQVGLIQPGTVTVYEYYTTENRCTKFYHAVKEEDALNQACQEGICRCMKEQCSLIKKFSPTPSSSTRYQTACQPEVDYVYKAHLDAIAQKGAYTYYTMRIVLVIKQGKDIAVQGKTRQFISAIRCKETLNLKVNSEYLIWGPRSDMWDLQKEMAYLLTSHSWIELWPTTEECKQANLQVLCQDLQNFVDRLMQAGCMQ